MSFDSIVEASSSYPSSSSSLSGFRVAYTIEPCEFGQGIVAKQFIPAGTLIWKYEIGVNVLCYTNLEQVEARLAEFETDEERFFFMSHVYLFDCMMNEIRDDALYWNHSHTNPNTGCGPDRQSSYAIRDIAVGEELLDDYGIYDYPEWFVQLASTWRVPLDFIQVKKAGFHVRISVRPSSNPALGLGVFAEQRIAKDELIWKLVRGVNVASFAGEEEVKRHLDTLPSREARIEWLSHVYCDSGVVNEILDEGKMWNHSETPNTYSGVDGDFESTYAKEDIEQGEELLDDYGLYEYPEFFLALCKEYNIANDFFVIKSS